MADDPLNTSDMSDPAAAGSPREDSDTQTARRELKQTSLSDDAQLEPDSSQQSHATDKTGPEIESALGATLAKGSTLEAPTRLAPTEATQQVSSPKKKRAHEDMDEPKSAGIDDMASDEGDKPANGGASLDRTDRSEPEKKRARDQDTDDKKEDTEKDTTQSTSKDSKSSVKEADEATSSKASDSTAAKKETQTSESAFAKSGFARHASSAQSPFGAAASSGNASPFGAAAASGSSTGFGSGASSISGGGAPKFSFGSTSGTSPFGTLGSSKGTESGAPKLSFASSGSASPFGAAGLNGKSTGFGSGKGFGSGFATASASSGPRLTSFASKSTEVSQGDKAGKPAKPFGAPDSDDEAEEDEDDNDDGAEDATEDIAEDKEESKQALDDKKKVKLHKVEVDDGESGEVTVLSVRAKMFQMEKAEGWKERGAGYLKVNVPRASVEVNNDDLADITSFDASVLEDEDASRVRLIMRQDKSFRVILNSPISPAIKFQLNKKLKAAFVLFTAFEGNEVKQVQMKMSEANATNFVQVMGLLQKQLADV